MRYRSATVADFHGLPWIPEVSKELRQADWKSPAGDREGTMPPDTLQAQSYQ
jgi:hypothetical protein